MLNRFFQSLMIVSTAGLSWLLMMALHELGHVWHGWLSGARLAAVHLPLIGFSRTDFAANPHPQFVAWGGPLWGCLLPLMLLIGIRLAGAFAACSAAGATAGCGFVTRYYAYLVAWFAGFCLIANGGYLLGGSFFGDGADDGGAILQHGGARWQLLAFGLPAIAAGLYLWNGLGPHFGFGESRGIVDRKAAVGATAVFVCVVLLLAFFQIV